MKKGFLIVLLCVLIGSVFSREIPEPLQGIWEGKDRFYFFENTSDDKNPEFVLVLKEYYGWYYDRAAEPASYNEIEARTPNAATHKDPEIIPYTITQLDAAYQITINHSTHHHDITTFAIVDDKIYLNPYTLVDAGPSTGSGTTDIGSGTTDLSLRVERSNQRLYRRYQHSLGFLMYEQATDQNISLLILDGDKYYDVRYWLTDMDYSEGLVSFKYHDDSYMVPKHLFADGQNYSCVSGRSKKVRNTMPPFELDKTNFFFNDDQSVLITETTPYLTKVKDAATIQALLKIVKEANARRKPDPEPIFPVKLPKFPGEE